MRLPTTNFATGVQSLGRVSVSGEVAKANRVSYTEYQQEIVDAKHDFTAIRAEKVSQFRYGQAVRGAEFGLKQSLANIAFSEKQALSSFAFNLVKIAGETGWALYQDYEKRAVAEQISVAKTSLMKKETEWRKLNDFKPSYTQAEIPADIQVERTETQVELESGIEYESPRENIPGWEVRASMYRSFIDKEIAIQGSGIENSEARTLWERQATQIANGNWAQREISAVGERHKDNVKAQTHAINEAINDEQYHVADIMIKDFQGDPSEKAKFQEVKRTKQEKHSYELAMAQNDMNAIENSLTRLQDPAYPGELDPFERRTYVTALEGKKKSILAASDSAQKAHEIQINFNTRQMTTALKAGVTVDPNDYTAVRLAADSIGTKGMNNRLALEQAHKEYRATRPFSMETPVARATVLAERRSRKESASDALVTAALAKTNDLVNAELRTDVMSFGIKRDLIPDVQIDPRNIVGSLQQIKTNHDQMVPKYGSTGYFTEAQAQVFTELLQNATRAEKIQIFGQVAQAFGQDAPKVWDQIASKTNDAFVVAGEMATLGAVTVADAILIGQEVRADHKGLMGDIANARVYIQGSIQGALNSNPERHSSYTQAIMNVYAKLSRDDGDYDTKGYDATRMDKAIAQVFGGPLIEYNGSTFEAPRRGMQQAEWSLWIREVGDSHIDTLGGATIASSKVMQKVRSGEVQLIPNGQNSYVLKYTDPSLGYIAKEKGVRFEFKYDAAAPTREAERAWAEAAKVITDIDLGTERQPDFMAPSVGESRGAAAAALEFLRGGKGQGGPKKYKEIEDVVRDRGDVTF